MNEHRKNAYRSLLYQAMLQIRPLAWRTSARWNPFSTRRALRQAGLAGALADAIHNGLLRHTTSNALTKIDSGMNCNL